MSDLNGSSSTISDIRALHKELDEASCPICMDHPHNALLLICSSHDKGCRSYICDTSYRHSNCFDRLKNLNPKSNNNLAPYDPVQESRSENLLLEDPNMTLKCPLCRGTIQGWKIIKEAREYLDLKNRTCSHESCSFIGNYRELRRHARLVHPTTRPTDIDPSREQAWRHLEDQRNHDDIVSAIRTAMPNAIMFGDYVIEDGETSSSEPLWSSFFVYQMLRSTRPRRSVSRVWNRQHGLSGGSSRQRSSWGQNFGLRDRRLSGRWIEDVSRRPRRQRFSGRRPDENHRR